MTGVPSCVHRLVVSRGHRTGLHCALLRRCKDRGTEMLEPGHQDHVQGVQAGRVWNPPWQHPTSCRALLTLATPDQLPCAPFTACVFTSLKSSQVPIWEYCVVR